jgi:CBS domain-containing protein
MMASFRAPEDPMAQKVRDVMHTGAETVRPDDTLKHAASIMQAVDVGPLPVCDGERIVGIVTDRDITVRAVAAGRDPSHTPVRDVMTSEIVYVGADQDVDYAIELMQQHEIRRLPVIEKGRLVGMVALADLARRADEQRQSAALEAVSQVKQTETDVP